MEGLIDVDGRAVPPPFAPFARIGTPRTTATHILLLPLALLRGLVFLLLATTYFCAHSLVPRSRPVLRHRILYFLLRSVAFVIGFVSVSVQGDIPPPSALPPLILGNHTSYLDVLFLLMLFQPAFVSAACAQEVPIVGAIATSLDSVFVDFGPPSSSRSGSVTAAILDRVDAHLPGATPPLALFPEGTTTNGTALLRFRTGAFAPGAPVLPVLIEYPFASFSPSWESIEIAHHIFFMLTSLYHSVRIRILPVYTPSPSLAANPRAYADALTSHMAAHLSIPISESSRAHKVLWHRVMRNHISLPQALTHASPSSSKPEPKPKDQ